MRSFTIPNQMIEGLSHDQVRQMILRGVQAHAFKGDAVTVRTTDQELYVIEAGGKQQSNCSKPGDTK